MSRQTLYKARYVLPISSSLLEDGAVLVESGLIRDVGHYRDIADAHPEAVLVDFGESVLLPPMVNAHAHHELTAFSDWAAAAGEPHAPQTFVDWILWLVRIRMEVGEDQLKASLAAGLKASLLAGTGAIGDIFTTLNAVEAYLESPLYGQVFAEVLGHDLDLIEERLYIHCQPLLQIWSLRLQKSSPCGALFISLNQNLKVNSCAMALALSPTNFFLPQNGILCSVHHLVAVRFALSVAKGG
jgi:hypothetical protein